MTTPSSSGYNTEPQDDDEIVAEGRSAQQGQEQTRVFSLDPPAISATPVVLDDGGDDDAEDYDDELGGRTALDLDAPRGARRGRGAGAPLDLSSLIGEFEAELQQQRTRRDPAAEPSAGSVAPNSPIAGEAPTSSIADGVEIARLRGELDAERGNLRRAQADLVNARRKAEQERARAIQDATERVIRQFFPLFDDFERGLISTRESRNYDQLSSGVDGILRNTDALLARYGVEPAETIGKLFDPTLHEAIGVVETADVPEETVVEELRKGYTLGGRLLRAAMVRVARHPASKETAVDAEAGGDINTDAAVAVDADTSSELEA